MQTRRLAVIADDITGSLDTGVQFAHGANVTVTLFPTAPRGQTAAVWVVDTESRHLEPAEAGRRVAEAAAAARAWGAGIFYKKVDSTLRGNIGAELDAMLTGSGHDRIAFAPAFPAMGRTTSGGLQLVNGTALDRTPFAVDPLNPIRTSVIADIIAAQTCVPVHTAGGAGEVLERAGITIIDAATDEELAETARLLLSESGRWAFGGSAGFAAALERMLPRCGASAGPESPERCERVLAVCGSLNPASLAQVDRAQAQGLPVLTAPGLGGAGRGSSAAAAEEACRFLHTRGILVIRTTSGGAGASGAHGIPQTAPSGSSYGSLAAAELLARFVGEVAAGEMPDALVVFGGDTLISVMRTLGIEELEPFDEVVPGVPVARAVAEPGRVAPRLLVSKAGGFGSPDVIDLITEYLGTEPKRKSIEI